MLINKQCTPTDVTGNQLACADYEMVEDTEANGHYFELEEQNRYSFPPPYSSTMSAYEIPSTTREKVVGCCICTTVYSRCLTTFPPRKLLFSIYNKVVVLPLYSLDWPCRVSGVWWCLPENKEVEFV